MYQNQPVECFQSIYSSTPQKLSQEINGFLLFFELLDLCISLPLYCYLKNVTLGNLLGKDV